MRKVVVIEGKEYPSGKILPCALYVEGDDGQIPVVLNGDWTLEGIVGVAYDFQRDPETLEISFEFRWDPNLSEETVELYGDMDPSISCTDVVGDRWAISKARIRQISLNPSAAYPCKKS